MKPTLLFGCALLAGSTLHAQVRLLPHAGYEQSHTTVNTSNVPSLQNINGFLKAGLRASYELKDGHSPFIHFTTNPAPVSFRFDNTGKLTELQRSGNLQFRFEAGYLFSSKPIQLGKRSPAPASFAAPAQPTTAQKSRCGSSAYKSSCGSKKPAPSQAAFKNLNMRLQPSLALAYLPSSIQSVEQKAGGFAYTPSWKTAIVPALGFEFANSNQRLFTLSIFYTKPLGLADDVATTFVESKTISRQLQPQMSTWGMTLGVPFNFAKSRSTAVKTSSPTKQCTRTYYRRCTRLS